MSWSDMISRYIFTNLEKDRQDSLGVPKQTNQILPSPTY